MAIWLYVKKSDGGYTYVNLDTVSAIDYHAPSSSFTIHHSGTKFLLTQQHNPTEFSKLTTYLNQVKAI